MPNSPQTQVVDPILSNVALGYRHPQHVGLFLFPVVPVAQTGGQIIEFDKSSFRLYNTGRAPGTKAKRAEFGHLGKKYALENHALDAVVPRERSRDAAQVPGINLASRAVNLVLRNSSLVLENQIATKARNLSNYDSNHQLTLAGTDQWSDYANSNPFTDNEDAKEAIRSSIGMYPNIIEMSAAVFKVLKNHPLVLEKTKYTSRDSITAEILAGLFDVDRVVIGKAIAFADDDSSIDIWGKDVIWAYVPDGSDADRNDGEPSYGYTYQMEGHPMVETPWWDADARSWIYGMTYERSAELTGVTAGFIIKNAVA